MSKQSTTRDERKEVRVPEAEYDGIFWRDGERWLRERGIEYRLLDLAPNLERAWLMEQEFESGEVSNAS